MTVLSPNPQSPVTCCGSSAPQGPAVVLPAEEAAGTLGSLLRALEDLRGLDLDIAYDGCTTKAGYHITEFKFARVTGLDCGANVESWTETILQIWDVEDSVTGERMTVDKLLGIAGHVVRKAVAEVSSRLVFEVSDGTAAIRLYAFDRIERGANVATIHVSANAAACKPLVRGTLAIPVSKPVPGCCG